MNLKQFAKPFEWQGATLWFLPFRRLDVDIAVRGLNELEPEIEYVNAKTGERVTEEPEAHTKAKEKYENARLKVIERWKTLKQEPDEAQLAQIVLKSDWTPRRLWDISHDTFYLCLPSIVAIDFPAFDDRTPTELRMFAAYWSDPGKTVADRWKAFKLMLGTATFNALWEGYAATRENPAPAKPELGAAEPADPKEDSSGQTPDSTTTAS